MKKVLIVLIALLLLATSSTGACWALTPDNLPGTGTGAGVGPGTTGTVGAGVDNQINNTTNTNNNANTEINISGSTISNSNIASNNQVNQTTNVSNENAITVTQTVTVMVNGQPLQSDVSAFVNEDGRTMLPVRAISEALGADVQWDGATQTATLTQGDKTVEVPVGQNTITVDGSPVSIDTAAVIKDGRTLLPVRAISEAFGAKIGWDSNTKTVSIDSGGQLDKTTYIGKSTNKGLINQVKPNPENLANQTNPANYPSLDKYTNQTNQQGTQTTGQTTQQAQTTTQPSQQTTQTTDWRARFPISKSQTSNYYVDSTRIITNSTLSDSGLFEANTTVNLAEPGYITVMVKVFFLNAQGATVYVGNKSWDLTDTMDLDHWTLNVPADTVPKVASVSFYQTIEYTQRDNLKVDTGEQEVCGLPCTIMDTTAFMDTTTGYLEGSTYEEIYDQVGGFTGQVQAGVWDINGKLLWTSKVYTYGVGANLFAGIDSAFNGNSRNKWTETVPDDIFYRAAKLEIRQGNKDDIDKGLVHLF